jgi:hypothetical protein
VSIEPAAGQKGCHVIGKNKVIFALYADIEGELAYLREDSGNCHARDDY